MSKKIQIDSEKYKLSTDNYYPIEFKKHQIIVGNSFNSEIDRFFNGKARNTGNYKGLPSFTINKDGTIYQHYDPKYYSEFIYIKDVNKSSISIALVNEGWLIKDRDNSSIFYSLIGNKFSGNEIIKKKWRRHQYWAPYTNEQMESLVSLCLYLCEKFDIYIKTLGHNTKIDNALEFNGVIFKSNFLKECTDLSPAFNFVEFKNKLDIKNSEYEQ